MRAVVFAAVLAPAIAAASPKKTVVWHDRVIDNRSPTSPTSPRPEALSISRTLYINNCLPNGCTVSPGNDSSITNRSSIPDGTVTLSAYSHGAAHWDQLVACVKDTFLPFNIQVVTTNPGNTAHHEVMIAGTDKQLNPQLDAGGIAPFVSCGATEDNGLSFVFANMTNDINYLCAAVAQEAAHVWGLSHELDPDDPMTYLNLSGSKRFQNDLVDCGEVLGEPFQCRCGDFQQNSFAYLKQIFGMAPNLPEPELSILRPAEGAYVKSKFPISAMYDSVLQMHDGTLSIDGQPVESWDKKNILAWAAPDGLTTGPHEVTLTITDQGERTKTVTINVNVMGSCADGCPSGTTCFDDVCTPGSGATGGLGTSCTDNGECATGMCASDGSDQLCTGNCDADSACPDGFECLTGANLCWPESSGGCQSSSSNGSVFLLLALGGLLVVRRRRDSHIVRA